MNKPVANIPKPLSDKQGCLRATGVGCGVLVFAALVIALVVMLRINTVYQYGVDVSVNNMQKKLDVERTLTDAQYYEMSNYLKSIKAYVAQAGRTKESMGKVAQVFSLFQTGLKDGRLDRNEIAAIRAGMLASGIPILAPPAPTPSLQTTPSVNP